MLGFAKQEFFHSHQHEVYNEKIERDYGYPMKWLDGLIERLLGVSRGGDEGCLAVTIALEHWTAILADALLNTPNGREVLDKLPPFHRNLWIWHAVEETEHKAVAFDVYEQVAGGFWVRYVRRIVYFFIVSGSFVWAEFFLLFYMLYKAKMLSKLSTYTDLFRFFLVRPGLVNLIWRPWLDFLRPSFHPWEHNNSHIIKENLPLIALAAEEVKESKL